MAPRRALGKRPHGSSSRAPQPPVPNLTNTDVNDPNQGRDLRISSYVRGVPISFNTHQLANLLGVPNDGDLVYCPPKAKGYLTEDLRREIAHQILNPGAPMKAASLRPVLRVYSRIIQHNIVPQSDHYSGLSQLTQYITYCVCTGERVSLPYLIIGTMHQATLADKASNLPYGHLITSLLHHLGVSMRGEVTVEDTMTSDIDWNAIRRMQMVDLPVSDDELEARPRSLGRVAATAAAAAAANAAYAAELERDDDEDRAEGSPVPAPHPTLAAPPSTSTAGPSQPPSDTMMGMMMEIWDTQRKMSRDLAQLARSLRVTQDQVHWLRVAYE
ncbi:hypothetical protein NE237_016816 [Protea cynaroides]|uniref:Putative plant transposon protein domain-containing protein n=1 Tax=Protea cynaroides TaxID=273540 RepID=A0A9Q0K6M3_9MAGN|nr:hypothetical protein NE237_016816 [Protea cynaroides]